MSNRNQLNKKNVVGFGSGIKHVGGKPTGEKATIFFVTKKEVDLSPEDRIPKNINGVKTDVIEVGVFKNLLLPECSLGIRNETITHLRGGIVIGSESLSSIGTLGALVKERVSGRVVALTNAHVAGNPLFVTDADAQYLLDQGCEFIRGDTAVGEKMYQNYRPDGALFGEVVADYGGNFFSPLESDSSIISIDSAIGVTPGIMGLTKYAQTFRSITTIPPGQEVYKSGRTSGTTKGNVISIDATILIDVFGKYKEFKNQTIITPAEGEEVFAAPGDSGSVVCVDRGNGRVSIIAQVHAGSEDTGVVIASPIDYIVNNLDIVPWDGSIIIKEGHSDIVSTNFGAVYEEDSEIFLSVTNDFVCEGSVCGELSPSVSNGCQVLTSGVPWLSITWINHDLVCGTTAKVSASGGGIFGGEVNSEARVDVVPQIILDSIIGIEMASEAEVLLSPQINITNLPETRILLEGVLSAAPEGKITLLNSSSISMRGVPNIDCVPGITLSAAAITQGVMNSQAKVYITPGIFLMTPEIQYSGGGFAPIGECLSGENAEDLVYGGEL